MHVQLSGSSHCYQLLRFAGHLCTKTMHWVTLTDISRIIRRKDLSGQVRCGSVKRKAVLASSFTKAGYESTLELTYRDSPIRLS